MNFFAVLLALLCEQLKPLRHGNRVHESVIGWVRSGSYSDSCLRSNFNTRARF